MLSGPKWWDGQILNYVDCERSCEFFCRCVLAVLICVCSNTHPHENSQHRSQSFFLSSSVCSIHLCVFVYWHAHTRIVHVCTHTHTHTHTCQHCCVCMRLEERGFGVQGSIVVCIFYLCFCKTFLSFFSLKVEAHDVLCFLAEPAHRGIRKGFKNMHRENRTL